MDPVQPIKQPSLPENTFGRAFDLLKARAVPLYAIELLAVVISLVVSALIGLVGLVGALGGGVILWSSGRFTPGLGAGLGAEVGTVAVFALLILFVNVLIQLLAVGAMTHVVTANQLPTVGEAFSVAWAKLPSLALISSLLLFIVGGGFALFVIPGIWLWVLLSFSMFALMVEDRRGLAALVRSRDLVAGRWWDIALRYFVLMLIVMAIHWLFAAAFGGGRQGAYGSGPARLVTFLFAPYIVCVQAVLWKQATATAKIKSPSSDGKKYLWFGLGWLWLALTGSAIAGAIIAFLPR